MHLGGARCVARFARVRGCAAIAASRRSVFARRRSDMLAALATRLRRDRRFAACPNCLERSRGTAHREALALSSPSSSGAETGPGPPGVLPLCAIVATFRRLRRRSSASVRARLRWRSQSMVALQLPGFQVETDRTDAGVPSPVV